MSIERQTRLLGIPIPGTRREIPAPSEVILEREKDPSGGILRYLEVYTSDTITYHNSVQRGLHKERVTRAALGHEEINKLDIRSGNKILYQIYRHKTSK